MTNDTSIRKLNAFLRKYKNVDFRTADLLSDSGLSHYKWPDDAEERSLLLNQVKAYQRLLRVLPGDSDQATVAKMAGALLKMDIKSALQIAGMGKKRFINDTLKVFSNDRELAEKVYKRALVSRKLVALTYINRHQTLEPHARTAGLSV